MPSLEPLKVAFALTFEGPHHIGTGRAEGLLNRTVRRDARGRPYVPGSALKGALRIEAERLARRLDADLGEDTITADRLGMQHRAGRAVPGVRCQGPRPERMCQDNVGCIVCRVFGNTFTGTRLVVDDAYPVTSKLEAKVRRRLQKSDPELLSPSDRPRDREVITRTSIDRRRRGVRSGALFTSEFVRQTTCFEGSLTGRLAWKPVPNTDPPVPAELVFLVAAAGLLRQVGAGASLGRGRCRLTLAEDVRLGAKTYTTKDLLRHLEWLPYLNAFG